MAEVSEHPSGAICGPELAAAVLHYAEGTIAPVAYHPAGCGTCERATELYALVQRTYGGQPSNEPGA